DRAVPASPVFSPLWSRERSSIAINISTNRCSTSDGGLQPADHRGVPGQRRASRRAVRGGSDRARTSSRRSNRHRTGEPAGLPAARGRRDRGLRFEGRCADESRLVPQSRREPAGSCGGGDGTYDVTARVAEGEERERIWAKQKGARPPFADSEARTSRQLPVVV